VKTRTEPRVWVLNLDAEHELETGRGYAPTERLRAIVARERRRLLGNLVVPGDIVLGEDELALDECERARGLEGLAWCSTPRALARLAAAGARPRAAPAFDVLRSVNARPFAAAVRAPLVGASFEKRVAATLDEALGALSRPAADGWLVRRTFGAAGRGRRRIAAGRPGAAELAWLVASLRRGALVLEPWVHVTREYTRSAWLTPRGEIVISPPCFQETTKEGAWTRTEQAARAAVSPEDDARLAEAVAAAGVALADAGYFGPFGIDAFRHRTAHGEALNPLSEINARFTMDWTTAFPWDRQAPAWHSSWAPWSSIPRPLAGVARFGKTTEAQRTQSLTEKAGSAL
jgi:hypothetical protein